jgi:hypothetical protein
LKKRLKYKRPSDKLKNKFISVESNFSIEEQTNESLEFNVFSDENNDDLFFTNKLRKDAGYSFFQKKNRVSFISKIKNFFSKKSTVVAADIVINEATPSAIYIAKSIPETVAVESKIIIASPELVIEIPAKKDIIEESYVKSLNNIFTKVLGPVEVEIGQHHSHSLLKSYLFGIEVYEAIKNKMKMYQLTNGVKNIEISTTVEATTVNQVIDFELGASNQGSWLMLFSKNVIPSIAKIIEHKGGKISCYSQHNLKSDIFSFSIVFSHEIIDLRAVVNSEISSHKNALLMDM